MQGAAEEVLARGFLIGGTSGRTTLNGEGLQHQDGHSHLVAGTIPNCVSYDPTFAYELVVILQDGMRRMYEHKDNIFYYVTVMNENYHQPAMPKGAEEGILRGLYPFSKGGRKKTRVQLMGSGTILREVIAAAEMLENDWDVSADVWSVTSFNELRRDGIDSERWNMLHPGKKKRVPYISSQLAKSSGPVVAATDYMRSYADQVRSYIDRTYVVLGTDGFGRSDMRSALRRFFEVNRYYVVIAALTALAEEGIPIYGINYKDDPEKALAFLEELGNPYAGVVADTSGRTGIDWGLYGVPETYVIDSDGRVVLRFAGPVTERSLRDRIRPAIDAAVALQ